MSWFSQKSQLRTEKSYYEEQSCRPIESMETQVLLNIESIEKFYNLNSQKKLIEIILDRKESQKLFNSKGSPFSSNLKDQQLYQMQKQQKRIEYFAQKYSYQALVEKFPKPKSCTNEMLLKILEIKLSNSLISSHQTRKNIWMLASGAKFNMINNKDLFTNLLNYNDYPKYFQRAITQDLHRTVNKTTSFSIQEDIPKLKNLLIAFSRRNPYIGYCQGLNFIAYFLLTMQFTEEQAFFLLSSMLESIIPMDYYTNMIGVVCDQQIFINILRIIKPHIVQKFDEVGLDPSVLSIEWFVCLFTSSLPFYLVKIVWDRLLVEGTRAFIKTGLIILNYFEDAIMQANQFHEIIMILEKGTKNLKVKETQFSQEFQKYYIDKKGLKIARDLYREYHIKQKLSQKIVTNKAKNLQPPCNPKWPICISKLQRMRRERQQIDVWVFRPQNPPKIIHDYLTNKPTNFQKKINITGTFISSNQRSRILSDSFHSVHQESFKSQIPQILSRTTKKPQNQENIQMNGQQNQPESKQNKKTRKFQIQEIPVPKNIQNKRSSELIIGRMFHICQKKAIQMQKIKKAKRSEIKFLSMIFEDSQEAKPDQKRAETLKKILNASQIFAQQDLNIPLNQETNSQVVEKNEGMKVLDKLERELLAQSRAVNFYNQFLQNNKELSSLIGGAEPYRNSQQVEQQIIQQVSSEKTTEGLQRQDNKEPQTRQISQQ